MKKRYLLMLALVTALASCSKSELEVPEVTPPDVPEVPVPITLSAGVDASTTPQSRALTGDKFPASKADAFRLTAYNHASTAPTGSTWSATPYFSNEMVKTDASQVVALTNAKYYPANGDKLYFYGYAPGVDGANFTAGTASSAPLAAYTITGQEDILWSKVDKGIAKPTTAGATQEQPEFQFAHQLMQLKFKLVKDATFQGNAAVTNITVKDIQTAASLNVGTGALTFSGASTGSVKLDLTANNGIDGRTLSEVLMVKPAATVKLSIATGSGATLITYPDITITLTGNGAGAAGMSHTITLTFKQNSIVPTAAITPWGTTGAGAGDMI